MGGSQSNVTTSTDNIYSGYIKVSPTFHYDRGCVESYPCQHNVITNGKKGIMNGKAIYDHCKSNGIPVPLHFVEYVDYGRPEIDKFENITFK